MTLADVTTIDTRYAGREQLAAAYLIEGADGLAFVETNTTKAVPRLLAALSERGRSPAQVRYVIITHIHLDHAGGAGALIAACPNATLLAHPRAAPHAIDPARIIEGARRVYGDAMYEELYGEITPVPEDRVQIMADGDRVDLGGRELSFLHTRGHANHHFCVHDERASAVFTGDAFGVIYPQLQGQAVGSGVVAIPSTTPTDFDAEAAIASIDRILATGAERVFPTHFGEQRRLQEAAAQLRAQLERYARVVEEGDGSGRAGEELDAFCLAQTEAIMSEVLDAAGLAGDRDALDLLDIDTRLNAQGLAFAVAKRRYKREQR